MLYEIADYERREVVAAVSAGTSRWPPWSTAMVDLLSLSTEQWTQQADRRDKEHLSVE
jgi:hypothetical protein